MTLLRRAASTAFGSALLFAASAPAWSASIFVSAKSGLDSAICGAATAPCRTFSQAHVNASAGGEIAVMDPGDYGRVTISKAIRIVNEGAGTAGILSDDGTLGPLIQVSAGAGAKVVLRGLTFETVNTTTAPAGVTLISGDLRVEKCVFRQLDNGVAIESATPTDFVITDTIFADNLHYGVFVAPSGAAGAITGVIRKVTAIGNVQSGVGANGNFATAPTTISLTIANSILALNQEGGINAVSGAIPLRISVRNVVSASNRGTSGVGFWAFGAQSTLRLAHSVATGNQRGVAIDAGVVESYGDNNLRGNTTNIDGGGLTPVGNQ